eukprot:gnl/TRDRNA2_/TRDRNA2_176145_c3_seq15.p1 gnl/TRDRNA2_/TRDRNA2_176145_c3~~gnl/TRDRNA2_/TRDRNA2_176145_c3_seq15.p1  ORF type:complete len:459 (+),score=42.03 gnl/TRDRNA2_/TRDRNA2_176145_c3_seq15:45-1421(+)
MPHEIYRAATRFKFPTLWVLCVSGIMSSMAMRLPTNLSSSKPWINHRDGNATPLNAEQHQPCAMDELLPQWNMSEYVSKVLGLPFEQHNIVTKDGYHLTMHRLRRAGGKVVFLNHGFCGSSVEWFMAGPNVSLAPLLYHHGYDVWMGNQRGNFFSKGHRTLSMSDPAFWNFTIVDEGRQDLPEIVQYILTVTKRSSMAYIGYSIGTAMFWSALSTPHGAKHLNHRFNLFIALAPVLNGVNVHGLFNYLRGSEYHKIADPPPFDMFDSHATPQTLSERFWYVYSLVKQRVADEATKWSVIRMLATFVKKKIMEGVIGSSDLDNLWKIMEPGAMAALGCASKEWSHAAQQLRYNSTMREWDYGETGNMVSYGQPIPPLVNLSYVKVPTALFFAERDAIDGDPENVAIVRRSLPNSKIVFDKVYAGYSHGTWTLYDESKRSQDHNFFETDLLAVLSRWTKY